jgi:hypothetical protein
MATKDEFKLVQGMVMKDDGTLIGIATLDPLPQPNTAMSSASTVPSVTIESPVHVPEDQPSEESSASAVPSVTDPSHAHVLAPNEQTSEDDMNVEKRRKKADQERDEHKKHMAAMKQDKVQVQVQVQVKVLSKTRKYDPESYQLLTSDAAVFKNERLIGSIHIDQTGRSFLVVDDDNGIPSFSVPFKTTNGQTPLLEKVEGTAASAHSASAAHLTEVSTSAPTPASAPLAKVDDVFAKLVDGTKVDASVGIQLINSRNLLDLKRGRNFNRGDMVAGEVFTVNSTDKCKEEVRGVLTKANEFIPFFTQGGTQVFKLVSVSGVVPDVPVVVASSEASSEAKSDDSSVAVAVASSVAVTSSMSALPVSDVFQRFASNKEGIKSLIKARKAQIKDYNEVLPLLKQKQSNYQQMLKEYTEDIMNAEKLGVKPDMLVQYKSDQSEMQKVLNTLAIEIREIGESLNHVAKLATQASGIWSDKVLN